LRERERGRGGEREGGEREREGGEERRGREGRVEIYEDQGLPPEWRARFEDEGGLSKERYKSLPFFSLSSK
jgi:hypothetical protein